jgi:transcriptional regulator with XRE-family HTH domain
LQLTMQVPLAQKDGKRSGQSVDACVGDRIRERRTSLRVTQAGLAQAVGISVQQMQEYETGIGRIGAVRLYEISRVLRVPVSSFFEEVDLPQFRTIALKVTTTEDSGVAVGDRADLCREVHQLLRAYEHVADPELRKVLEELARLTYKNKTASGPR